MILYLMLMKLRYQTKKNRAYIAQLVGHCCRWKIMDNLVYERKDKQSKNNSERSLVTWYGYSICRVFIWVPRKSV